MSVHVVSLALKRSRSTSGARLVLIALADRADDDGFAQVKIRELGSAANISERQVKRTIKKLVEGLGEVALVEPGGAGRGHAALYRVLVGVDGAMREIQDIVGMGASMSPKERVTGCHPYPAVKGDIQGRKGDIDGKKGDNFSPPLTNPPKDSPLRCSGGAELAPDLEAPQTERSVFELAEELRGLLCTSQRVRAAADWMTAGPRVSSWRSAGASDALILDCARSLVARGKTDVGPGYLAKVVEDALRVPTMEGVQNGQQDSGSAGAASRFVRTGGGGHGASGESSIDRVTRRLGERLGIVDGA